jgi:predicted TIM-barrel fold metal-dependent hydrolase
VPFYLEQMDNNYQRHRHWAGFEIKAPPSSYCREGRFLWNVIQDDLAMQWRHLIGVDCMTWSSDFPHIVTEWPRSQWHVQRMMKDLPTDERHKICWANAARFYQLET